MNRNTILICIYIALTLFCMQTQGQTTAEDWNNKGGALFESGQFNESIAAYDKAIEINPQYADPWYNKGNALSFMGRYQDAIEAYNKSLEINSLDADVWNNKGIALSTWKDMMKPYRHTTEP